MGRDPATGVATPERVGSPALKRKKNEKKDPTEEDEQKRVRKKKESIT